MSTRQSRLDTAVSILVGMVAMAALFHLLDERRTPPPLAPVAVIAEWREHNESGIWLGPRDASVVLTEFMDFQCPFCAALVPRVDSLKAEFPGIAVVFQHYPLRNHPFALPAAVAAECAERQGRFAEMYRVLFASRDSLGVKPWHDYAQEAGMPDLVAFGACVESPPEAFPRIAAGTEIGRQTGVRGTPTVWANGEIVRRTTLSDLRDAVAQALADGR